MPSIHMALDRSRVVRAEYTSKSENDMSLSLELGMGSPSGCGRMNGLWVKTEWKNWLKRDAFSWSDEAVEEPYAIVEGNLLHS